MILFRTLLLSMRLAVLTCGEAQTARLHLVALPHAGVWRGPCRISEQAVPWANGANHRSNDAATVEADADIDETQTGVFQVNGDSVCGRNRLQSKLCHSQRMVRQVVRDTGNGHEGIAVV